MASLYDLAMQYLNQSVPKTFKYDRTNQPETNPILPVQPKEPVKKILPVQNSNNFSVYNPDPSRTRTQDNYNERPYKSTLYKDAFSMMGDPEANQATGALNADGLMSYAGDKQLTGIPGAAADFLGNSFIGKGLDALGNELPFNRRAVYENELLGQGIRLNDTGQIVAGPGSINTAQNIMAGYNANKITADTIQNRIDNINENMKDPDQKKAKLDALYEFAKINDIAVDRTNTTDPNYSPFDADTFDDEVNSLNADIPFGETVLEDEEEYLDYTDPNIYNTKSIYTQTAPTYTDPSGTSDDGYPTDGFTETPGTSDDGYPGGADNKGFDPGVTPGESGFIGLDKDMDVSPFDYDDAGTYYGPGITGSSYNAGDQYSDDNYMVGDTSKASPTGSIFDSPVTGTTKPGESGGTDSPGGNGTHCCTAANERGDMTLTEVKKLRAWHRKQSKIWQRGYDVWGKVIADNLVAKSKWQSNRVRDFYNHKIYKKRTIGSIYADIVIYPMSMIIGSILTVMPPILGYQENKRHGKSSS